MKRVSIYKVVIRTMLGTFEKKKILKKENQQMALGTHLGGKSEYPML